MPFTQPDVLVIGGGVVGLTTALKLADRGVSVTLLDRQSTGREASWAGAGMLPPGNLPNAATPEARLRSYSHSLWKEFSSDLLERTGLDNGYHLCGAVDIFSQEDEAEYNQRLRCWAEEGIRVQMLDRSETERLVADLNPMFTSSAYLPDFAQIRNPRHMQALRVACLQRGVEIVEHVEGICVKADGERVSEVRTSSRLFLFDRICIAAGAWSASILQSLGCVVPVKPVRGQIVQLQLPMPPFRCVIEKSRRYLVPRRDGLILIGSTEEDVGFVKQNTTEGVAGLLEFAKSLVPSLAHAEVIRSWAGLRPGSPDELPLLGGVPGLSNLIVGAGHFRSGLQMSPGTATILTDLLLGTPSAILLEGLTADRFLRKSNCPLVEKAATQ